MINYLWESLWTNISVDVEGWVAAQTEFSKGLKGLFSGIVEVSLLELVVLGGWSTGNGLVEGTERGGVGMSCRASSGRIFFGRDSPFGWRIGIKGGIKFSFVIVCELTTISCLVLALLTCICLLSIWMMETFKSKVWSNWPRNSLIPYFLITIVVRESNR